jgi:hypothetical protein
MRNGCNRYFSRQYYGEAYLGVMRMPRGIGFGIKNIDVHAFAQINRL